MQDTPRPKLLSRTPGGSLVSSLSPSCPYTYGTDHETWHTWPLGRRAWPLLVMIPSPQPFWLLFIGCSPKGLEYLSIFMSCYRRGLYTYWGQLAITQNQSISKVPFPLLEHWLLSNSHAYMFFVPAGQRSSIAGQIDVMRNRLVSVTGYKASRQQHKGCRSPYPCLEEKCGGQDIKRAKDP